MTKIGILLYFKDTNSRYFFCCNCSERFSNRSLFGITDVYYEQFPPEFGQNCHTEACENWLKSGPLLFERYTELSEIARSM